MTDSEYYARYWTQAQPIVAGYIGSMLPDFHETEDLLQDVAVILLRKFREYDPGRSFVGWALGVARREILAMRRSHSRSFLIYDSDVVNAVAEVCEELTPELETRARALRQCLRNVGARAWEILRLRYEGALKPREIAVRSGIAAGTVRVTLSRIRALLRECVERKLATHGGEA